MTSIVTVFAHAKLNLGLHVTGRREDGYHLLESIFVPIELADRLDLDFGTLGRAVGRAQIDFEIDFAPALPGASTIGTSEQNLAIRAARAFCEAAGLAGRLGIRLAKSIPVGAGLGGGSSDAGTVLRALDERFPGLIPGERLLELAARLGADVPFCLRAVPSLVRGIGEEVSPLGDLPELSVLLVNPGVSLSTADVFAAFDRAAPALTLAASRSTMRSLEGPGAAAPRAADSLSNALISGLSFVSDASEEPLDPGLLANDLELFATSLCPGVGELQEQIRKLGARFTAMSGSGATVYGIFSNDDEARSALERANFEAPTWAITTRTLGEPKQ